METDIQMKLGRETEFVPKTDIQMKLGRETEFVPIYIYIYIYGNYNHQK